MMFEIFQYWCVQLSYATLFPYTTLFRSGRRGIQAGIGWGTIYHEHLGKQQKNVNDSKKWTPPGPILSQSGKDFVDRKSTRLNSSHTVISYAVFCLKKKRDGYENHTVADF